MFNCVYIFTLLQKLFNNICFSYTCHKQTIMIVILLSNSLSSVLMWIDQGFINEYNVFEYVSCKSQPYFAKHNCKRSNMRHWYRWMASVFASVHSVCESQMQSLKGNRKNKDTSFSLMKFSADHETLMSIIPPFTSNCSICS